MADVTWERPIAPPPAKARAWWAAHALEAAQRERALVLPDQIQAAWERGAIRARARWGFEATNRGARLTVRADVRPEGFGWVVRPFVRRRLRRLLLEEAERHAAAMDEAWRRAPW